MNEPQLVSKFTYNATVKQLVEVTGEIRIFRIELDSDEYRFIAGQYAVLGLLKEAPRIPEAAEVEYRETTTDPMIRRAYSISSGSGDAHNLEFFISLVSSGALTPRLFALKRGDRLFVAPRAKGIFTVDKVPEEKNVLMVATGTGLAPYISMLRSEVLANQGRLIAIIHGASYSWDLGYRRELESLNATQKNFTYLPVISRPHDDSSWRGKTGRLPPILDEEQLDHYCGFQVDPLSCHIFLCGNPLMIEDAEERLVRRGFKADKRRERGTLHMEKY